MILIEDSITDDVINKLRNELDENVPKNCWRSSSATWEPGIKEGVVGSCINTFVSDNIQQLIEKELKSSLPKYKKLTCQYYIWQPLSGISWHNDSGNGRLFGATLYLNDEWHPNYGGWFIWEDDDGYHTILPKKKLLVINDNYQNHCVTPISLGFFRCTIQIWGD